jgi:hypothetical protein
LTGTALERSDLAAFTELIQELIGGVIQRHVFSRPELELMLDLETCQIRKSTRADVLRRYLKAVQQQFAEGAATPLRLSLFVQKEAQQRVAKRVSRRAAGGSGG